MGLMMFLSRAKKPGERWFWIERVEGWKVGVAWKPATVEGVNPVVVKEWFRDRGWVRESEHIASVLSLRCCGLF